MAIVTLRLPEVKTMAEKRPQDCPHCGCAVLQRWGQVNKAVIDPQIPEVLRYRYRCSGCGKTFRHYPQGITRADQTDRMRFVCALMRKIGASLRQTSGLLGIWQRPVCHMSVWRDLQWAAVRSLPEDGPHLLHLLWKRIVPPKGARTPEGDALAKLRLLVLKMGENWSQYALFLTERDVPTTNNATERAIGRWRNRSKTTRGFKSLHGLFAAFRVCNGMYA